MSKRAVFSVTVAGSNITTTLMPVLIGLRVSDIGDAAANYIGLTQPVSTGFVATLAYLGPRGAESLLCAWIGRKK